MKDCGKNTLFSSNFLISRQCFRKQLCHVLDGNRNKLEKELNTLNSSDEITSSFPGIVCQIENALICHNWKMADTSRNFLYEIMVPHATFVVCFRHNY